MADTTERRLADGRSVALRPAGLADVPAIAELFLGLSPDSYRRRFHAGQPSPDIAARLAAFGPGTFCLVAAPTAEPGRLAAEARYVPAGNAEAELAMTVGDAYQGAGLGRVMLDALVDQARRDGIERLSALVLLANTPMLRLLQRYGWVLAGPTEDFCVVTLQISAVGGMPGWPAGSSGRRVLVERRNWLDDGRIAALRAAGQEVRQCTGPDGRSARRCPLVTAGRCELAQDADLIVSLLPGDDPECAAVLAAHRQRWPARLA